jgi:soluble lytic murein transglycosylase-like protein
MNRAFKFPVCFAVAVLCALPAVPCLAAESAVLRNGFSIRHERREAIGSMTRLYISSDGSSFVDVPTEEIDHIEAAPGDIAGAAQPQTLSPVKAAPAKAFDLNTLVASSSEIYRLDPDLVNSVIRAESGFNVRAVSPKGAQGLMQLMPQTASQLGVHNTFDPQDNVEGGTRYLRELLERYNFDLIKALAAYNAGPERVEQYGGVPPFYETKAYVARIVRDFNKKKLAQKNGAKNPAPQKASAGNGSARTAGKQNPSTSKPQTHTQAEASNTGSR